MLLIKTINYFDIVTAYIKKKAFEGNWFRMQYAKNTYCKFRETYNIL